LMSASVKPRARNAAFIALVTMNTTPELVT
jgi:hypothetical protein